MIRGLKIENFKSVKSLDLACRRVNLFIGEPNTGKSNILEALGFLSWCGMLSQPLRNFVRFKTVSEIFHDNLAADGKIHLEVQGDVNCAIQVLFERDHFEVRKPDSSQSLMALNQEGGTSGGPIMKDLGCIKFYRYRDMERFDSNSPGALLPPDGGNLFASVYSSKELRERVVDLFRPYGLALVMKPQDRTFEIQKNVDGVVTAFRYATASDTLLRIIFHTAAMDSNKGATLVFEEPEAHAFPYYTKQMGEEIALDTNNQYFIATHNPYLLCAILEKARREEVSVFVTHFKDYTTRVKPLSEEQLGEMLGGDPFFMSQRFIEEEPR